MNDKLPIIRKVTLVAALATTFLFPCMSLAETWEDGGLPPIKGLKLGMPIKEAVAVMNERAGPIWVATMKASSAQPYKVMRIPGESMQHLRSRIIQLMSLVSMQLYRIDPTDTQDIFIVVPSSSPDTAKDLGQVGVGVLQSLFRTGFFAWAGADGNVNLFIIGPTLCNALFDASSMPMDKFAEKFADAYNIPQWKKSDNPETNSVLTYESSAGPSVALAEDKLGRRTIVVWSANAAVPIQPSNQRSFD
jgi:hypothetical protein